MLARRTFMTAMIAVPTGAFATTLPPRANFRLDPLADVVGTIAGDLADSWVSRCTSQLRLLDRRVEELRRVIEDVTVDVQAIRQAKRGWRRAYAQVLQLDASAVLDAPLADPDGLGSVQAVLGAIANALWALDPSQIVLLETTATDLSRLRGQVQWLNTQYQQRGSGSWHQRLIEVGATGVLGRLLQATRRVLSDRLVEGAAQQLQVDGVDRDALVLRNDRLNIYRGLRDVYFTRAVGQAGIGLHDVIRSLDPTLESEVQAEFGELEAAIVALADARIERARQRCLRALREAATRVNVVYDLAI